MTLYSVMNQANGKVITDIDPLRQLDGIFC